MPGPIIVHLNVYSKKAEELLDKYIGHRSHMFKLFKQTATNEVICEEYRCKDAKKCKESICRALLKIVDGIGVLRVPKKTSEELFALYLLISGKADMKDKMIRELYGEQLNPIAEAQVARLLEIATKVNVDCDNKLTAFSNTVEHERMTKLKLITELVEQARKGEIVDFSGLV